MKMITMIMEKKTKMTMILMISIRRMFSTSKMRLVSVFSVTKRRLLHMEALGLVCSLITISLNTNSSSNNRINLS